MGSTTCKPIGYTVSKDFIEYDCNGETVIRYEPKKKVESTKVQYGDPVPLIRKNIQDLKQIEQKGLTQEQKDELHKKAERTLGALRTLAQTDPYKAGLLAQEFVDMDPDENYHGLTYLAGIFSELLSNSVDEEHVDKLAEGIGLDISTLVGPPSDPVGDIYDTYLDKISNPIESPAKKEDSYKTINTPSPNNEEDLLQSKLRAVINSTKFFAEPHE